MRGSIAHVALQRFYSQLPSAIPGAERVTPENVEAAVELMHRCVDGALDSGLRIDADDLQRRELGQGLQRDLEQLVRADAAASSTFVPRKLEVSFKALRARAGGRGQRQDRPRRRRPAQRPRDRRRLQVRRGALGDADPRRGAAPDPALPARAPRSARASSRWAASTCRSAAGAARAGCCAPATTRCRASPRPTTSTGRSSRRRSSTPAARRSRSPSASGRVTSRHDPHGGDCPAWCDLWRMCRKERP